MDDMDQVTDQTSPVLDQATLTVDHYFFSVKIKIYDMYIT